MACIILLLMIGAVWSIPLNEQNECGYQGCPKTDPGVLNVHIVAHTHDDVGWLKTVDQYYYGSRNDIQKAGVQYILDSVIKELWDDPKRKFIYVETAFFWKWWVRQPEEVQTMVRTLVREGRLQFVGGAWSMNDEAAAHYQSTVDQFTWGLSKINETFGPCALPRVGWQIDPFGHAREFASLLAGMGYDGLFLGRIDYQDKRARLSGRNMEMLWRGDDDLGKSSDIFTGVLYNTYSPPPGFCFDVLCNDEPIIDDPDSPMFNVDDKMALFIDYVRNQARHYRSNNVIVTMGGDFTYQDAHMWYTNLDKLIEYTNLKAAKDGLNMKLFYSTPNCYLKAVKDANPTLPIKQDDFFPYASDPNSYWTGYFTSRPTTKYFERQGNDYLQMAKQLQVLSGLPRHNMFVLNNLKSAMGVMQHHDAITGTEKQHVSRDYERLLDDAIEESLLIPRQAFTKMIQGDENTPPIFSFDRCRLNESSCYTSENSHRVVVTLYNPVAWKVKEAVRLPVVAGNYEVYAPNGDKIDSQVVDLPKAVLDIPTRTSSATHEVVFIAYLKGLKIKSFYVQRVNKVKRDVRIIRPDRNRELYEHVNDYWRDVKDKLEVDIKIIEDALEKDSSPMIPEEPARLQDPDIEAVDLNVLKDKDLPVNDKVLELERIIKEARRKIGDGGRKRETANAFPHLNDEGMRMLADDPGVVEKLEDFFVMENEHIKLHIDNTSGAIKTATFSRAANLSVSYHYYRGCVGNNEVAENRSSGAYIFRPNATRPEPLAPGEFSTVHGKVVNELRMTWSDNVYSTVRLYKGFEYLEVESVVGPIDIKDNIGKEFIVKYETDILNNGEFYTDSNGRQTLKRKLNKRPQWNVTLAETVGGNYYPVTNEIFIEDNEERLTIMTDRSQGGSSLAEGEIELMLHRRLLHDDAFGVGEALNETANGKGLVVRGTHRLMMTNNNDDATKKNIIQMHLRPLIFVSDAKDLSVDDWLKMKNCFSWIKDLPEGIHLLTLEPWGDKLMIRLENYLSKSNVEVDLANIFNNINLKSVKEMTLSAYEEKSREQWHWKAEKDFSVSFNMDYGSFDAIGKAVDRGNESDDGLKLKLAAKEIRTFIVEYELVE